MKSINLNYEFEFLLDMSYINKRMNELFIGSCVPDWGQVKLVLS
jgi:hypothetical protein